MEHLRAEKWVVLAGFVSFVLLMTFGSARFFIVPDRGAKIGKLILASFVGIGLVISLTSFAKARPVPWAWSALAVILLIYSHVMFVCTVLQNRHQRFNFVFSEELPKRFVDRGTYRWVRHPFYSSYCAAWFAPFVASHAWPAAAFAVFMSCIYYFAARAEERVLLGSEYSDRYMSYMRKTGMLIPTPKTATRGWLIASESKKDL